VWSIQRPLRRRMGLAVVTIGLGVEHRHCRSYHNRIRPACPAEGPARTAGLDKGLSFRNEAAVLVRSSAGREGASEPEIPSPSRADGRAGNVARQTPLSKCLRAGLTATRHAGDSTLSRQQRLGTCHETGLRIRPLTRGSSPVRRSRRSRPPYRHRHKRIWRRASRDGPVRARPVLWGRPARHSRGPGSGPGPDWCGRG